MKDHTQQWHDERAKGIGSSEIAAMLGLNKYMTPLMLWEIKTGRAEYDSDNEYTKAGKMLEGPIGKRFAEESGLTIEPNYEQYIYTHPDYPHIKATPDFFIMNDGRWTGIVEIKSTQKRKIDRDDFPLPWYCQLQYQLGTIRALITDAVDHGYVAWLEHGLFFRYLEFDFDAELYEEMVEKVNTWWATYVEADVAPPPISAEDVYHLWPKEQVGKVIQATDDIRELYRDLLEAKQTVKQAKAIEDALSEQMKLIMRDAEAIADGDVLVATYKANKDSMRVDTERVKEEHPELMVLKPGPRVLRLK